MLPHSPQRHPDIQTEPVRNAYYTGCCTELPQWRRHATQDLRGKSRNRQRIPHGPSQESRPVCLHPLGLPGPSGHHVCLRSASGLPGPSGYHVPPPTCQSQRASPKCSLLLGYFILLNPTGIRSAWCSQPHTPRPGRHHHSGGPQCPCAIH